MSTSEGGFLRLRHAFWVHMTVGLLGSIGLAACLVAPIWGAQPLYAAINSLVIVAFTFTAVLLADESGQAGNARLFIGCAVSWAVGLVGYRQIGPLPLLEYTFEPLLFVFVTAVLLRYPEARLGRPSERVFILVLLGWLLGGRILLMVTSDPTWHGFSAAVWWPTLLPSRKISESVGLIFYLGAVVLAVAFLVLIGSRLHHARGMDRRELIPVVVAAAAVAIVGAANALARLNPSNQSILMRIISFQAIVMSLIPFAFLIAAVGRRLARAAVADLVLGIGRSGTIEVVRAELRRVLCDPTLEVFYWVPEAEGYVDPTGRVGSLDVAAADRFLVPVEATDRSPLAAVLTDRSLERHRDLVDVAVAASALALENARLQARILAQLEQVRASRARIVEAGLAERRRLERDLHDGAQQRLLGLAMQLAAVPGHTTDPAALTMINKTRDELHQALQELRDLARGIHPAVLTQAGLGPALESVAERLPLSVELHVPPQRWDPAIETTAYFVACEALTNTVKHAKATSAHVEVRPQGHDLRVAVSDDGRGAADLTAGSGLTGLRDRVAALGGQLFVTSRPEVGTQLVARIPCE